MYVLAKVFQFFSEIALPRSGNTGKVGSRGVYTRVGYSMEGRVAVTEWAIFQFTFIPFALPARPVNLFINTFARNMNIARSSQISNLITFCDYFNYVPTVYFSKNTINII